MDKQYNYQMALRTKELKKDVEFALLQNKLERADNGSNQGRLMRGLPTWMQTNWNVGASTGAIAVPSSKA